MGTRFPFSTFPTGWYVVAFSCDVEPGGIKTVHYFGEDIVLFRTTSGVLSALDKVCPHLGAHLGGGKVEGECLRCPFHGWAFDGQGHCVEVPYAPKIPPRAKVSRWPLVEHNGFAFVYYSPDRSPPTWEPAPMPEEGWTPDRTIRWEVRSHPQEVCENTVDCSHLYPVHHVISTEVREVEQREHMMRVLLKMVATGEAIGMPDEINDVELEATLHSLGQIVAQTRVLTAGLHARQRIHPTPIDDERIAIFAATNLKILPDPGYTAEMDKIFYEAFLEDFPRDFPIWENKVYLERPLLVGGDGPIGRYRKWARQFYADGPSQADRSPSSPQPAQPTAQAVARPPIAVVVDGLRQWAEATPRRASVFGGLRRLVEVSPGGPRLVEGLRRWVDPAAAADSTIRAHHDDRYDDRYNDSHIKGTRVVSTVKSQKAAVAAKHRQAEARFDSVDAYFRSLEDRFDPAAAGDLQAVVQWVLTGEDGQQHFAEIKDRSVRAASGKHRDPTLTIEMSAQDYLRMINGELNGARAFSTGRGRLRGPVRLAMRMQKLFPLDRAVETTVEAKV